MKKIILYEDLDKINFYSSLFLIFFYKKIYFREASYAHNNFFFKKNINKIFFQIGLKNLSGSYLNKSFQLKKFLIRKYINNNFQTNFFKKFSEFSNIKDKDNKKIIYSLENYIYTSNSLAIESTSYICKKIYFPNNLVYYFPSTKKTFLTISEVNDEKLKIVSIILLMSELEIFVKKFFNIIFNKTIKIKKKNPKTKKKEKYPEIGYFPHKGLKYSTLFKKNFFYSNFKKSIFYKNNIETLSLENFDKLTLKFLRFYKLKNSQTNEFVKRMNCKKLYLFVKFFFKNIKLIKKNKLMNFIIFAEIYLSIIRYTEFFEKKKYKLIFFYNDFLIPPALLLAANILQIKTASFQDRLLSYFYYHHCLFDIYLIAGKKFEHIFKTKHLVNKYEVLGLTRSGLIYERELSLTNNIKSNSQFSGIVTCLLLGFRKDWDVNLYGEVGNSWSSIINFCKDIKKLADVLNNKYFIIKFKNIENTEIISAINKIISKSNNLVLTTEHNVTSVELISNSQFVIGKYSTIMDEALIAGKNVLIHDPENFVSTFGFYRKNKFLIANNFEDLLFKTNSILDGKNQFSKHYEEEKNLYVKNYLTDNGIIGSQKKIMELLENYIK